jgi:hypothetical protein
MFHYFLATATFEHGIMLPRHPLILCICIQTIDFFKHLAELGHEDHGKRRSRRARKPVPTARQEAAPIEEEKPEMSAEDVREQMRILKEQMEAFAKLQATIAAANAAAMQAPPAAPAPAPTQSNAPSTAFAPPPAAPTLDFGPPPPAPTLDFAPPPPAPAIDFDAPTPLPTFATPASKAPKRPVEAPRPTGGFVLTAEDLKRPLRPVNKAQPLQTVDGNNNAAPAATSTPKRSRLSMARIGAVEKAVVIAGKRVQTRSLPGEDSMSFSELIKVASKISLKKTVDRSPGGTPLVRSRLPDNPFSQALLNKFRHARASLGGRDSFGGSEKENEWN